jgi:hypothetical protein
VADKVVLNNAHKKFKKLPLTLAARSPFLEFCGLNFGQLAILVMCRNDVNTSITCSASNNNLSTPLQTTSYINIKCKSSFLKELKNF